MRRLVATLACRINGSRLFGKPLQLLDVERRVTVLDHMIDCLISQPAVSQVVLAIADAVGNELFHELAARRGLRAIVGDETDVLARLIRACEAAGGTDVFRVTTESPFTYFEAIETAWSSHCARGNDATVIDGVPEGSAFEMFRLEALERCHREGDSRHRSEMCSLYLRENRAAFQVEVIPVPEPLRRTDLRLTIDYPEDLVLCRRVYAALRHYAPCIPLDQIVALLDSDADTRELVRPYVKEEHLYL